MAFFLDMTSIIQYPNIHIISFLFPFFLVKYFKILNPQFQGHQDCVTNAIALNFLFPKVTPVPVSFK